MAYESLCECCFKFLKAPTDFLVQLVPVHIMMAMYQCDRLETAARERENFNVGVFSSACF